MSEFKRGDLVKAKDGFVDGEPVTGAGVVLREVGGHGYLPVKWEVRHSYMHDCDGGCEHFHGWFARPEELQLVVPENV